MMTQFTNAVSERGNSASLTDYVLELTEEELEALKVAVENADGRKTEVKQARRLLGVS